MVDQCKSHDLALGDFIPEYIWVLGFLLDSHIPLGI